MRRCNDRLDTVGAVSAACIVVRWYDEAAWRDLRNGVVDGVASVSGERQGPVISSQHQLEVRGTTSARCLLLARFSCTASTEKGTGPADNLRISQLGPPLLKPHGNGLRCGC